MEIPPGCSSPAELNFVRDIRLFRTHVEILKHSHPGIVVLIVPEPRGDTGVELKGEGASIVLKWRGKTMHSVKAPEEEARLILDRMRIVDNRTYLLFGAGLGHLPRLALERLPARSRMIVIEPSPMILREILSAVDMRAVLFDARVRWVCGGEWIEQLRTALRKFDEEGCRTSTSIMSLPSYRTYFSSDLATARGVMAQFINERDIDMETRKFYWNVWNGNLIKNTPAILSSAPLRFFTTTFQHVPAVLLGAGPGLDDVLEDLPRLKSGALVIAVDTALAPALSAGCEPDIVLAQDAQVENALDFKDLPPHKTTLMFDAFCYPTIPAMYPPGARIAALTGHILTDVDEVVVFKSCLLPMLEYLVQSEIGFLQNGGSVITAAFDLARLAGCSSIAVAGVDLSYPGFQSHSKLTNKYRSVLAAQSRYSTPETNFYDYFSEKARMRTSKPDGKTVWSDRVLVMYKNWMEDGAARAGIPCYSIGRPRGAALAGYPEISPADFLAKFAADRSDIDSRLSRCRSLKLDWKPDEVRQRVGEIRAALQSLDSDATIEKVGPFDLDLLVSMASSEISERLHAILAVEPETEHLTRRQQAARASRQYITPFLDRVESALDAR